MMRDLLDFLVELVLSNPDAVLNGRKGRLIAQKGQVKEGFGKLLIRVIYEQRNDELFVVSAYWARPERYRGKV